MASKQEIRSMLSGGDRRSIGRVAEVIHIVNGNAQLISILVDCLRDEDTCVRMRAADALEKISHEHRALLQTHKLDFLSLLAETTQQEVRWHLAAIVPRLQLTASESRRVAKILQAYLEDQSSIVKTSAMQGLADLTEQNSSSLAAVVQIIRSLTESGTPAMRARGRKLLAKLEHRNP